MATAHMNGSRLAYVVVPLKGNVVRDQIELVEKPAGRYKDGTVRNTFSMKRVPKEEPAGFMVYFPRGHALRFKSMDQLKQYNLDKKPHIINLEGLNDPNSPIGRLLAEQDENSRRGAFQTLEQSVIKLATAKTGHILMPEQVARPKVESEQPTEKSKTKAA